MCAEAQLRFPRQVANGLWEIFGATLRRVTDAWGEAVVPRRLGEQATRVRVAGLGNL